MGLEAAREAEQDIWYNGYMEVVARCCKWHGQFTNNGTKCPNSYHPTSSTIVGT